MPATPRTQKLKNLADPSKDSPGMAAKRAQIMAKLAAANALAAKSPPGLRDAQVNTVETAATPAKPKSKTEKLKQLADPSKDSPGTAAKRAEIMAKLAAAKAAPAATPAKPKSKTDKLKQLADPSKDSPGTAAKRAEIMAKVAAAKAKTSPAPKRAKVAAPADAIAQAIATDLQTKAARTTGTPKSKTEKLKHLADPSKDSPGTAAKRAEIMAKVAAAKAKTEALAPVASTPAAKPKSRTEKLKHLADPSQDSPRTAAKRAEIVAKIAAAKAKTEAPAVVPTVMSADEYASAQSKLQELCARIASLEQTGANPSGEELRALRADCGSLRAAVLSAQR